MVRVASLVFAVALAATAGASPLDEALGRIEAARAGVRTLRADFTQDKVMSLFAERMRSTGRLSVLLPDRLRWELLRPDPSVFILSGRTMRYRLPGARGDLDVRSAGSLGVVLGDLVGFLGGPLAQLRARYRMELGTPEGTAAGQTVVIATPLGADVRRSVSRLRMRFEGGRLGAVTIEEPGGDRSEIRFSNVRVNEPLGSSPFTL
ncbi:MAG: outer membrane lipoprotein carrier protein LolA [Deltaproteobacteria bacterium]|nr:outer membrane lipoprotein carrier protein LolA [Deltaproteobacteria bacterium]